MARSLESGLEQGGKGSHDAKPLRPGEGIMFRYVAKLAGLGLGVFVVTMLMPTTSWGQQASRRDRIMQANRASADVHAAVADSNAAWAAECRNRCRVVATSFRLGASECGVEITCPDTE